MKSKLIFFFLLTYSLFSTENHLAPSSQLSAEKPPTIKILVKKNSTGVILEARGSFAIYNPETGKKISSH